MIFGQCLVTLQNYSPYPLFLVHQSYIYMIIICTYSRIQGIHIIRNFPVFTLRFLIEVHLDFIFYLFHSIIITHTHTLYLVPVHFFHENHITPWCVTMQPYRCIQVRRQRHFTLRAGFILMTGHTAEARANHTVKIPHLISIYDVCALL